MLSETKSKKTNKNKIMKKVLIQEFCLHKKKFEFV